MMMCFFSGGVESGNFLCAEAAAIVLCAFGEITTWPWAPVSHLYHEHCLKEKISAVLPILESSFQYAY